MADLNHNGSKGARVLLHPKAEPEKVWPGYQAVDVAGGQLAFDMLCEIGTTQTDELGARVADHACLEDWPRQGRPFRNIVAEYLERARASGAAAEAGFCAVLSDYLSFAADGLIEPRDLDFYPQACGVTDKRAKR